MGSRFLIATVLSLAVAGSAVFPGKAAAADNEIKEIQSRGVLRVCFADAKPSAYKDVSTGKWIGYNVDMAELVAAEMGVKTEYVDATWSTIIISVQTGKCDIATMGITRTAKRAEAILFVNPYQVSTLSAVVKADSPIQNYKMLDDAKLIVAVGAGTVEESYTKANYSAQVKSLVTDKMSDVFLEVASGRADVAITETRAVRQFMASNPNLKLRELDGGPIAPKGVSWAVAPGEYHLQQFLNVFFELALADGTKDRLFAKWYGQK